MSFTVRPVREGEPKKGPGRWRKLLVLVAASLPSALKFYNTAKAHAEEDKKREHRLTILKRTVTILLSVLCVMVLLLGTLKILIQIKVISVGSFLNVVSAELPKDANGFTNVLLLGQGDKNHSGVDLTDTLMIASIDPGTPGGVVLLSIPRDTYILKTEKMGAGRINSLYRDYKAAMKRDGKTDAEASKEGMTQLAKEIGTLIGQPIHGVVKVNFSGFTKGIDLIGGIDVEVPEDLVDTEYPLEDGSYGYQTFSIGKGLQHLDGETALKYARSRHSTSDFSRSARQQQIITAAAGKVQEEGILKNVGKMTEMLSVISENVESTFSTRELLGLASVGKELDRSRVASMQINDQNGLYGALSQQGGFLYAPPREEFEGASVLLPVSSPPFPVTWKQIQTLTKLMFTNRSIFIKPSKIMILNAGAASGVGRSLGGELIKYGFNVIEIRNYGKTRAETPTLATSSLALNPALLDSARKEDMNQAKDTIEWLKKTFDITSTTVDAAAFGEEQPDIVIVLGKDFSSKSIQEILSDTD